MATRILPAAKERILEIWDYTERTWGEDQADNYVKGLVEAIDAAEGKRHQWRRVKDDALTGVYFIRYRHHYLFFRELADTTLAVISILHESMDLPARLKADFEREGNG